MVKIEKTERICNGRLKQTGRSFRTLRYNRSAVFECECGKTVIAFVDHVKGGQTTSCGCYHRERSSEAATRHGHTCGGKITPEFRAWKHLIERCTDPKNKQFKDYGGRGITVCGEWKESFAKFLADVGRKPIGATIDRIDNSKGYQPGNCRWVTSSRNNRNKRNNRLVTLDGKTMCCADWADEFGISQGTLHYRLKAGWSVEQALTTPVQRTRKRTA